MASTELYGRYDARNSDVYPSTRCMGDDEPRHVTKTAVDVSIDVMRGNHALEEEEEGGGIGPPWWEVKDALHGRLGRFGEFSRFLAAAGEW